MEPFGRSPECNKMLSFHEEIQQVLYPQCGLMKCVCSWGGGCRGGGQGGGGGVSCKGRGTCEYMCSDLLFPTTSLGFCHANLRHLPFRCTYVHPINVNRSCSR